MDNTNNSIQDKSNIATDSVSVKCLVSAGDVSFSKDTINGQTDSNITHSLNVGEKKVVITSEQLKKAIHTLELILNKDKIGGE